MEEAYIIHLQLRAVYKTFQEAFSHTDQLTLMIKSVKAKGYVDSPSSRHTRLCMLACLQEAWEVKNKLACTKGEEIKTHRAKLYELIGDDEDVYNYLSDYKT